QERRALRTLTRVVGKGARRYHPDARKAPRESVDGTESRAISQRFPGHSAEAGSQRLEELAGKGHREPDARLALEACAGLPLEAHVACVHDAEPVGVTAGERGAAQRSLPAAALGLADLPRKLHRARDRALNDLAQ